MQFLIYHQNLIAVYINGNVVEMNIYIPHYTMQYITHDLIVWYVMYVEEFPGGGDTQQSITSAALLRTGINSGASMPNIA